MQRSRTPGLVYLGLFSAVLLLLDLSGCSKKINSTTTVPLVTVRVSIGSQNQQGNGPVGNPAAPTAIDRASVSDDGRFVAFTSSASNLVPNDNNSASDVFLRDNLLRTTTLVSINIAGTGSANSASFSPSISGDGRYIVFVSTATDLDPAKSSTQQDIFVRDMQLGMTSLVSRATGPIGTASNGNSGAPQISKSGRFVVYHSNATNLDPADTDTLNDIYVRDLVLLSTTLISRADGVNGAKGMPNGVSPQGSIFPSICRDGHLIVYESDSSGLAPTKNQGGPVAGTLLNIYMRDTNASTTVRLSVAPVNGGGFTDPDGLSEHATISGDGNSVSFRSFASNLVQKNDNNPDIYWRSVTTPPSDPNFNPGFQVMSVHTSGVRAGSGCDFPMVSETGTLVVWDSPSTSLVDNDTNGVRDCFMHDRNSGITSRVSVSTYGGELNAQSLKPVLSANNAYVVFYTEATNAGDLDTNGASDFYMRGPPF